MNKGIWGLVVVVAIVAGAAFMLRGNPATPETGETDQRDNRATIEQAELVAIAPYTGSGTATRSFDGSMFRHTVTASLDDPATGKFYEGWLVMKTSSGPQFFSTGEMRSEGGSYVLDYSDSQNYPEHSDVVITEETLANGLDNNPEAHVLEGTF